MARGLVMGWGTRGEVIGCGGLVPLPSWSIQRACPTFAWRLEPSALGGVHPVAMSALVDPGRRGDLGLQKVQSDCSGFNRWQVFEKRNRHFASWGS
jgi:hypothetical protein